MSLTVCCLRIPVCWVWYKISTLAAGISRAEILLCCNLSLKQEGNCCCRKRSFQMTSKRAERWRRNSPPGQRKSWWCSLPSRAETRMPDRATWRQRAQVSLWCCFFYILGVCLFVTFCWLPSRNPLHSILSYKNLCI